MNDQQGIEFKSQLIKFQKERIIKCQGSAKSRDQEGQKLKGKYSLIERSIKDKGIIK
ncbi:MAG TPA: hypothetical protein P5214_05770 [Rectinema sp.]|nr:hypothetical protein [Rectinema sp.]